MFYVYIYVDPADGQAFYVGKGRAYRVHAHLKPTAANAALRSRIEDIRALGMKPTIHVVNCAGEGDAFEAERALISAIGRLDRGTGPLLNRTAGGQGSSGRAFRHSEATKAKIAVAMRARVMTPEHKEKIRVKARLRTFPASARVNSIAKSRTPEARAAMSVRIKAIVTPEHMARMTALAAEVNRGRKRK